MDPKQQLADACVKNDKGVITGILAKGPAGQIVKLRPGSVSLAASVERGIYLEGLKDGWSLISAKSPAPAPIADKK